MKAPIRFSILCCAVTGLMPCSLSAADSNPGPDLIHLTSVADSGQNLLFCDGDPQSKVRRAMGEPDEVIGDSVWVYRRFAREGRSDVRYAAPNPVCDTTLVSFLPATGGEGRKVGEIARVSSADVTEVAAAMIKDPKYIPNRVAAVRSARPEPVPPEDLPFLIHVTAVVNYDNSVLFRDGDTEERVLKAVGQPSEILPGEIWAYRRYERHNRQAVRGVDDTKGCETTLVTFSPGAPGSGRRVTAIVMAQPSSLAAIAECLKKDPEYLEKRVMAWHLPVGGVRASIGKNP
ncbi:MAG: hypothetical protein HZC55_10545 [Verrucomicrobia bacterium]|nr:hypothetical protein [Verrucomicrobiota bacterium]